MRTGTKDCSSLDGEFTTRQLAKADILTCERILRGLPDWFGIEDSNRQYIADLATMPTLVAAAAGEVLGFLTSRGHNPASAEIHVIAVRRDARRRGVGRALLAALEEQLTADGVRFLQVKTLGPSHPDPSYARTRSFYAAMGFLPLEETTAFWGADQPCLVMVKVLASA